MIDFKKAIIRKEIPENETTSKTSDAFEKVLDLNKQQKGKGIRILIPKQILQKSLIALTKWNTFIIYSLYWEKEVTKKV